MQHNLKAPAPRRNRALLAVAAAVVLIVGIAAFQAITGDEKSAPSPAGTRTPAETLKAALQADPYSHNLTDDEFAAGTPPTAQDLAGIWQLRTPHAAPLVVSGDLDWSYGSVRKNSVGSSTLEGRTWTRNLDSAVCGSGRSDPLPWTAGIAGDGSLHLVFTGSRNVCTPADEREVWDRLAPGPSPVMDYVRETSGDINWAARTESNFEGVFVNTETGHVLDVAANGSYKYLDTVTGQEFTPSDEGTLEPGLPAGTIAGTCGGGNFSTTVEVGTTEEVPGYLAAQKVLRIAAADACSPGIGAGGVWLGLVWA